MRVARIAVHVVLGQHPPPRNIERRGGPVVADSSAGGAWNSRALSAYLRDIHQYPRITHDEVRALARRIRNGDDDARHELARANLRLVVSIARSYARIIPSFDLLDLIQEGSFGLYDAVDRYDPDRGTTFSTYATPWIRQKIQRVIGQRHNHTIRLPVNVGWDVRRVQRIAADLHRERGRAPFPEELEEATGLSAARINTLLAISHNVQSLDAPREIDGDRGDTLLDTLIVHRDTEAHEARIRAYEVRAALAALPPREREILEKRFGFMGDGQTLAEAGSELGVSRQRVMEIQRRALRRLRAILTRRSPRPATTTARSATS